MKTSEKTKAALAAVAKTAPEKPAPARATKPAAKTIAVDERAAKRPPRPIKLGDRVTGTTSRGNEIRGKVVEILRRATGYYVGVQAGRGERIRYTRPTQLSRV